MKNNAPTPTRSDISILIYAASQFTVLFVFSFLLLANYYELSPASMFKVIIDNLFIIHFNNVGKFPSSEINGHNIILFLYKFMIIAIAAITAVFVFLINPSLKRSRATFKQIVIIVWLCSFFVFAGIQQFRRHVAISSEWAQFGPKTEDKRILSLHGMPYMFAKDCLEKLPRNIGVELISDQNISKDPFKTYLRSMAYYFYPKISIRFDRGEPKEGIIFFYKNAPLDAIPDDYMVLSHDKDKNYVLAVPRAFLNEL